MPDRGSLPSHQDHAINGAGSSTGCASTRRQGDATVNSNNKAARAGNVRRLHYMLEITLFAFNQFHVFSDLESVFRWFFLICQRRDGYTHGDTILLDGPLGFALDYREGIP